MVTKGVLFILQFISMTKLMEWKPIILFMFAENNAKNKSSK